MCILIDNSGSMRDKRTQVTGAALALVRASNPSDEVCVINYNDETFIDKAFTGDIKEIEKALTYIDSRGGTATRDAVLMSLDYVEQKARNRRKVLVLITDGNDTSSTTPMELLLSRIKDSRVLTYCIGLLSDENNPGQAERMLGKLAKTSGGESGYPGNLADVESFTREVAEAMRTQ